MRPIARRVACCVACCAASAAHGQLPLNLDFERGSLRAPTFAFGWDVEDPPTRMPPAGVRRDSTVVRRGRWSLRVDRTPADSGPLAASVYWDARFQARHPPPRPPAPGSTTDSAPAESAPRPAGTPERLRLTGWVRTAALGGEATIVLVQYRAAAGAPTTADTVAARGVRDTRGWTQLALEAPLDPGVAGISVGVRVTGARGTAWFDDLALTQGGRPVTESPGPAAPTAAEVAWLRARSTPFAAVDPSAAPPDGGDLAAFGRFVGGARIVALGEATHGTREFTQAKHRLFAELARGHGFTVLFFEDNVGPVEQVNHHLRTGAGDLAASLRGLFQQSRTEEVHAMLAWARAYNAAHPTRPVEVAGVDVQDPRIPIDSVLALLGRADPAFRPAADSAYRDFRAAWGTQRYPYVSDSATAAWVAGAARVRAHVESRRAAYVAAARSAADSVAVVWAAQHAAVAHVAARLSVRPGSAAQWQASVWRDSAMAAMLLWQLDRRGPDTRGVLWAHNGHIGRTPNQMGGRLEQLRPGLVRVVALTAAEGEYRASRVTAVGMAATMDPAARVPVAVPFDPAPPNSVAGALASFGAPYQFADLRGAAAAPDGRWLVEPRPALGVGWAVVDYPYVLSTLAPYDGLVFVRRTTALRPLP